jgi:hypothetical protein
MSKQDITRTRWTIVTDLSALNQALKQARGCYQEAVILGRENLSTSLLAGKAQRYSGHYRRSIDNLLDRLTDAGIEWSELRGPHGARLLCIGPEPDEIAEPDCQTCGGNGYLGAPDELCPCVTGEHPAA